MMGYGNYGDYGGMMAGGFGFLHSLFAVVVLADFILLGIFLWKKIQGK